jgi:hypothetical protein
LWAQFFQLLLEKDKLGQTALHCAFRCLPVHTFQSTLNRVKAFDDSQKTRLLAEQDERGVSLCHILVKRDDLTDQIKIFGVEAFKTALVHADQRFNSSIHYVMTLPQPMANFQLIRHVYNNEFKVELNDAGARAKKPAVADPTAVKVPLRALFRQNADLQNPLHLACRFADLKKGGAIIGEMSSMLGKDLFFEKLQEQDFQGRNVLLIALHSGDTNKVAAILENLTPEQRKKLAEMPDKDNHSALYYACRYGDRQAFERIIAALGPRKTHEIVRQEKLKNLEKLLELNTHHNKLPLVEFRSLLANHTCLFQVYSYFCNSRQDGDFESRLVHAKRSLQALEQKDEDVVVIPPMDPSFMPKPRSLVPDRSGRYAAIGAHFQFATNEQLAEFKDLLAADESRDKNSVAGRLTIWKKEPGTFAQLPTDTSAACRFTKGAGDSDGA